MHISDTNAFTPSTTALKKRKRDVVGGGNWNQDKSLQENIPAYQLDFQDINMLASPPRFNLEPTSIPSQRQWLHLQPAERDIAAAAAETQKKRRILQPHSHNQYHEQQQQQLRPHSGSPSAEYHHQHHNSSPRKPPPPALMIPFFDNRRDPELSIPTPDEYDAVSPRTMAVSPRETSSLPPPVLRPCHVCHRKPSTKVMLDAYADCELCGQRACYICLRECNSLNCNTGSTATTTTTTTTRTPDECDDMMHYCADIRREDGYLHTRPSSRIRWDGKSSGDSTSSASSLHRQRKVCSCCAVEGLTDTGEEIVWCLDCVRREEMNH